MKDWVDESYAEPTRLLVELARMPPHHIGEHFINLDPYAFLLHSGPPTPVKDWRDLYWKSVEQLKNSGTTQFYTDKVVSVLDSFSIANQDAGAISRQLGK